VALVTGAASGIGAACAARLVHDGAKVAGVDVQDMVESHRWGSAGGPPSDVFFRSDVDVRDSAQIAAVLADLTEQLGPVDILVNAAGVVDAGAAHELSEDAWDHTIDINLKGSYLTTKHVAPAMLERQSGSIVHIASTMGLEGAPGTLAYSASKGGVVLMTKSMAWDYGRYGIRVNCVCPGFIQTPLVRAAFENENYYRRMVGFSAFGRHGLPSEIASVVAFLASEDASYVTGHALVVDGGWMAGRSPLATVDD